MGKTATMSYQNKAWPLGIYLGIYCRFSRNVSQVCHPFCYFADFRDQNAAIFFKKIRMCLYSEIVLIPIKISHKIIIVIV